MSVTPEVCQLEIRVEILQVIEEPAHVGDARDFPVGGGRVSVERLDRRHGEALSVIVAGQVPGPQLEP